jgi:SAM-dependent methyltransferase
VTATYRAGDAAADAERARLAHLSDLFDAGTISHLTSVGVTRGWQCLEVGAGSGSIARALAGVVAPEGSVLATDIDLRFLETLDAPGVEARKHDITTDPLPGATFDLVHARGVLEHISTRDEALANMVAAAKSRGVVVVEDVDWLVFEQQVLPPAFAEFHQRTQAAYVAGAGYDPYLGRRLHSWLSEHGLVDVTATGRVFTMHGGTPSMEWYVLGLERALPVLVEAGIVEQELADAALAEVRDPACRLLSPLQMTVTGRTP